MAATDYLLPAAAMAGAYMWFHRPQHSIAEDDGHVPWDQMGSQLISGEEHDSRTIDFGNIGSELGASELHAMQDAHQRDLASRHDGVDGDHPVKTDLAPQLVFKQLGPDFVPWAYFPFEHGIRGGDNGVHIEVDMDDPLKNSGHPVGYKALKKGWHGWGPHGWHSWHHGTKGNHKTLINQKAWEQDPRTFL